MLTFVSGLRSPRTRPENVRRLGAYLGLHLQPCDNAVLWVTIACGQTHRWPQRRRAA
jgi:hypothetical protein